MDHSGNFGMEVLIEMIVSDFYNIFHEYTKHILFVLKFKMYFLRTYYRTV